MSIALRLGAAAAVAAAITTTFPAHAHHAGGLSNSGAGGPIVTLSAETLDQGHSAAGISVVYSDFSHLSDDTLVNATATGNEGVHGLSTIQSYALSYVYGLTNDLMVGFRLPYVRHSGIRAAEDDGTGNIEAEAHGPTDGIGDTSFFAQYRFYNDRASDTQAGLILGLKTPTGKTNSKSYQGELLDAEFQPGSGSWDPLFGIAVTHRLGPWSFDANALYNLVTTGTQSTDLGDQFLYNLAISYRLKGLSGASGPMFHGAHAHESGDDGHAHHHDAPSSGPALDLVLELNGELHQKQERFGASDINSGGHTIYISPGVRLGQGNFSGYASVGIPVLKDENGLQPEPNWRLLAGVSLGFE